MDEDTKNDNGSCNGIQVEYTNRTKDEGNGMGNKNGPSENNNIPHTFGFIIRRQQHCCHNICRRFEYFGNIDH